MAPKGAVCCYVTSRVEVFYGNDIVGVGVGFGTKVDFAAQSRVGFLARKLISRHKQGRIPGTKVDFAAQAG